MKHILLIIFTAIIISACGKDDPVQCDDDHTERVGAVCNDGSRSEATGQGACSHHGGVKYWLCK